MKTKNEATRKQKDISYENPSYRRKAQTTRLKQHQTHHLARLYIIVPVRVLDIKRSTKDAG